MRGWCRPRRLPIALATIAVLVAAAPADTHEASPTGPVTLQVQGSPLGSITTSGLELTPAFTASTTDYTLQCGPGANTFSITLAGASGGTIQVESQSGTLVSSPVTLVENQALVVDAPDPSGGGTVSYWIRCLPRDFPALTVTKAGMPPPGWYLTGNLGGPSGSGSYAMILDSNGTPVWYQKTAGLGAIDVTPVAKNSLAWTSNPGPGFGTDPSNAFSVYDLSHQQTLQLKAPAPPLDPHELVPLANGDYLLLATPLRAGMDLRRLGFTRDQTIIDCLIEEVTPSGRLAWKWRASDHVKVAEAVHSQPFTVNRQLAHDVFHCNSIDQDSSTGDLLLSLRSADAVYRIERSSGRIIWKLGGNPVVGDGEKHLAIRGDPDKAFHGQHDARFQPKNDVSLFDNQTWSLGAARGVEYHVDTAASTATLVWQYRSPDGEHSNATGGFRRYEHGNDNLVAWGLKSGLFTEVDAAGRLLLNVTLPKRDFAYRTVKTPLSEFDVDLLHRTAGLPADSFPPVPRVLSLGVDTGGTTDRTSVVISGSGFTGANAVTFGPASASSFSVESDDVIRATAPPGSGAVSVRVTTPGGTSSTNPQNALVESDRTFTAGVGSWTPNVNATVSVTPHVFRSPPYALEVAPTTGGFCSAFTSKYHVAGNSVVVAGAWVKVLRGSGQARSALVFYDDFGSVLWIRQSRFRRVTDRWSRTTVSEISPAGATSVALAIDGLKCESPMYVDDASLAGSSRYVYGGPALSVTSVGPSSGSRDGGTTVTITGSGLTNATSVRFGAVEAQTFAVDSDSVITAVAPAGSGIVDVTVTTPHGSSPATVRNVPPAPDTTFEHGPGSWVGNVNSTAVSTRRARTGSYALESVPTQPGFQSVISGAYPAAGGAVYNLSLWVATPKTVHVRPFMIFYSPAGDVRVEQGAVYKRLSPGGWTRLTLAARSPQGTAAVAVGVDSAEGGASIYLDDVTLTSSLRFTYR